MENIHQYGTCIAATIEEESPHPDALIGRGLETKSVSAAQIFPITNLV